MTTPQYKYELTVLGSARLSKAAIYTVLTPDAADHGLPLVH